MKETMAEMTVLDAPWWQVKNKNEKAAWLYNEDSNFSPL